MCLSVCAVNRSIRQLANCTSDNSSETVKDANFEFDTFPLKFCEKGCGQGHVTPKFLGVEMIIAPKINKDTDVDLSCVSRVILDMIR